MSELLKAQGLMVRFGGLTAVSDVSFSLRRGEIVGLIGPNGAGKTTLFSSLVGLQRLSAGEIHLEGKPLHGRRPHVVARAGVTKTFQNTALFPGMTLLDNVMTAALLNNTVASAQELAHDCLERVGMAQAAQLMVDDLTFPQKALGEVARALATRPRILLLDEVMAALTPLEMDRVMDTLRELRDRTGLTMVVVEHHMRAIMNLSERILVLNFGKLIADGSPQQVSRNEKVIQAYLGSEHAQPA
ncbi:MULTISPECIES: ABC transporter ATP-binding protein [unclassified Herbaspirillum]|uniref:ABC transporter ATP-binding protein n=1 Tax=unclassified Herbaspirillum TaxID=2624150 RepID=UPI00114F4AC1|nr:MULTISPECIES: ABC transporter ATP-binding protein [unclassified Herbaspirillum]MBB5391309.1 branched-chain amino acid transport system ATP-binding protein [Herbaspirillum sp. SJZ102]TQK13004.1 amino acid/amide ABC transporter ATP-binding protein 1 (HAAT family) [Herbaspirillum sp. SJZ130]TQK15008.1 amino acid/amide ABC transporter ATP-binding protein 1 (HAAT family) [Herbaspirillum sp. SJZ106]TWC67364.1 amino acid/amide ABC transporter ATP-binding protein 1 (HAAT family) [Herbaspirillum sp. 